MLKHLIINALNAKLVVLAASKIHY